MEASIGSSSFIASIFIIVSLFPVMDAVECFVLSNGHTVQFACGPNKACCGSQCCPAGGPFYTHWYFWLAVCMFLMVVLGFGISACRHFRKERKFQQCCARTKREIGADLLLNYHLMRTDLHHLPLYDEATAISQSHFGPLIYSPSTLPPPPLTPSTTTTMSTSETQQRSTTTTRLRRIISVFFRTSPPQFSPFAGRI